MFLKLVYVLFFNKELILANLPDLVLIVAHILFLNKKNRIVR